MQPNHRVDRRLDVKVPMRDGVNLSADIYLPRAQGRFPVVLMRTPYDNNTPDMIEKGIRLANNGYAAVLQDVRGRWDSDGEYYPFVNEGVDGYDTQEWIGRQEWSTGKIGMAGGSYVGLTQWQSAPHRSQYLTCMIPRAIANDFFSGLVYPGGAFQLGVMMNWGMRTNGRTAQNIDHVDWTEAYQTLPLIEKDEGIGRSLGFWKDWVRRSAYDDYWDQTNVEKRWAEIAAPALNMGGWYDLYAQHTFVNFNGLREHGGTPAARQSKLIVGPWPHALSGSSRTGDVDFGAASLVDLDGLEIRWFDHWLKGVENGIADEPPLRLFIMGANYWRDEHEWPLARTDWQKWYFHSDGSANSVRGDGVLSTDPPTEERADRFVYDPEFPVQTIGGATCCRADILPWGPYDQRSAEARGDVLCYTTPPLDADMETTGPIKVVLYASTDGSDTDWTAKLVDVSPTGYAMNLCDGIIRARYRESMTDPALIEPGRVYEYEIDVGVTGNVFRKGHRIRIDVSSSNFPRFDRNLNTGRDPGTDTDPRAALQTVHHSPRYLSHVVLPVIPT